MTNGISTEQIWEVYSRRKSTRAAAKELGMSHTALAARLKRAGYTLKPQEKSAEAVSPGCHVYLRPQHSRNLNSWALVVGANNQYNQPGTSEMTRLALDFLASEPEVLRKYVSYCALRRLDHLTLTGSGHPC